MGDANDFTKAIKKAAMDAMEASKPVNVFFGKVTSASPLKINVEQKMMLGEKQLVLTRNVTDYTTSITGGNVKNFYYTGDIDSGTAPVSPDHVHAIGKVNIKVHNALKVGDEVVLIRQQEGQKFIVVDRLG